MLFLPFKLTRINPRVGLQKSRMMGQALKWKEKTYLLGNINKKKPPDDNLSMNLEEEVKCSKSMSPTSNKDWLESLLD